MTIHIILSIAVLLERVFLRIGSAETDEQLETILNKFLTPVLLKLASQTDGVRKKVLTVTELKRDVFMQATSEVIHISS